MGGKLETAQKKKIKSGARVSKDGVVNVADAVNILSADEPVNKESFRSENKEDGQPGNNKIATLSQDELVKKAFATPDEKEIEQEFEKEKETMRTRDDHSKKENEPKVVSGWGSWAGEGAPPPKPKKAAKKIC